MSVSIASKCLKLELGCHFQTFSHRLCSPVLVQSASVVPSHFTNANVCKGIHSSAAQQAKSKSMYRYTQKFLNGGMREPKFPWTVPTAIAKGGGGIGKKVPKGTTKPSLRRLQVLNKIFLDNIKEIMSTGEILDKLKGRQVYISGVRVLEEMQGVQVFWFDIGNEATGYISEDTTENLLRSVGPVIRQELSNQKVVSMVPPITFKQDPDSSSCLEVAEILNRLGLNKTKAQREKEQKQHFVGNETVINVDHSTYDKYAHLFVKDFKFDYSKMQQEWNEDRAKLLGVTLNTQIFNLNRRRIMFICSTRLKNSDFPFQPLPYTIEDDFRQSSDSGEISTSKISIKKWARRYAKDVKKYDRRNEEKRAKDEERLELLTRQMQDRYDALYDDYEDNLMERYNYEE